MLERKKIHSLYLMGLYLEDFFAHTSASLLIFATGGERCVIQ